MPGSQETSLSSSSVTQECSEKWKTVVGGRAACLEEAGAYGARKAAVMLLHEALQRDAVDGRILLAPVHLRGQL